MYPGCLEAVSIVSGDSDSFLGVPRMLLFDWTTGSVVYIGLAR